jgi:hypothetical protein
MQYTLNESGDGNSADVSVLIVSGSSRIITSRIDVVWRCVNTAVANESMGLSTCIEGIDRPEPVGGGLTLLLYFR